MARMTLHPIGSPLPETAAKVNHDAMEPLEKMLMEKRAAVHAGWGQKYVERAHKKGKMTSWERIDALADPGTIPLEVNTLVNDGELLGPDKRTSPGAGVVTAYCQVESRWVMVNTDVI